MFLGKNPFTKDGWTYFFKNACVVCFYIFHQKEAYNKL